MALWRIRATVDDRPGYLSVLTASLALRGVNILTVQVHTTEVGAVDDFLVDAPDRLTEADLRAAVERGRGRDCWVARSEARGLADQPTRVLGLATRLVREPDGAGEVLRTLLGADEVTWRPTPAGPLGGVGATTMVLADPSGGSYELRRGEPSFTPAEYARAQALVELAATVARRDADRVTLVLPDGAEVLVRPATVEDVTAVVELHASCSARSRQRRYLGGAACPSPARLRRLLEPAQGLTLVATAGSGGEAAPVVAMANLLGEGDEAEAALLVRDDWQRRGLGTALLRRLLGHAERTGYAAVLLHVQAENTPMLRAVRRLDRPTSVGRDGSVLTVTVPLVARPVPLPRPADATARRAR
ncbi:MULTISPECIES: GNAT family N-acetyltransferase [Micromonospora]|uniref:GNAT family N-acetyltransferase n=1 Tax=Micromonospora solifontis TaxID=2487138 RepID=A0ABX9WBM3_9ACTN|nr:MULTISPECIES: GNAT family N-acetyltransferase [Micromonospora]NES12978.1 GNAT family N-acetyltransferase [Micromonospora sp. PPF5-17B]NES38534.1 GNAT family N-acetyltransferase [Micromonospora solifontis]NES54903.1 GNAT family N-acetyltransferase [Micromonospora sp. PPF5-6]RNL94990.1 GNAT family N-acetyltransferase [Micromonospora solifontis]